MKTYLKHLQLLLFISGVLLFSCGSKNIDPDPNPGGGDGGVIVPPVDPAIAPTTGFFLNDWKERTFTAPQATEAAAPSLANPTEIVIDASKVITKVTENMFGQNSVSYRPPISGHAETIRHLKNLKLPLLRFPGGAIADTYFFNRNFQDKPADAPDYLVNSDGTEVMWKWNYFYGKNNNAAERTDLSDYYSLLEQTGTEGMITVNYGYARYGLSNKPVEQAAHLAADWVRQDNGRTKYWEIGNENHGGWEKGYRIKTASNKDGQPEFINGGLYAKHAKVFIDSMRKAAGEIGKTIYIGVGLIESKLTPGDWLYQNSVAARDWNEKVLTEMKSGSNAADFYIVHNYYLNTTQNTYAQIISSGNEKTKTMADFVKSEFSKYGSPVKPIALTEYNIYSQGNAGSMQQVSFVNGMHTTLVLGEAIKNNLGAAARWDLFNKWDDGIDQGLFDLGDEPGGRKGNPRPVFYYMYYFQKMFGDRMIEATTAKSSILPYASSFSSGQKGVVLVNKNTSEQPVRITLKNAQKASKFYWYALTGGTDNGDFSRKVYVNGTGPEGSATGGPLGYADLKAKVTSTTGGNINLVLPARSVVYVVTDK